MDDKLIERIRQFNEIKYGNNDNETRIVFATLKPRLIHSLYNLIYLFLRYNSLL